MVAAPGTAQANGRPPLSVKLEFRPGSTTDILVGVTFGLMVTDDDAVTWRWICESAVGFQGTFDPDYEYAATGTIFATTFDGLRYTRDKCTWSGVPAPLGNWLVTSVAIGPDGTVYAGAADPVLGSGIFRSTDDGASFQPTGNLNQSFDWFDTIEVAPGDPQRIYVTGYKLDGANPRQKLLFRSLDGGASWQPLPTSAFVGTDLSDLQVMAIDPSNPDVVYVKMTFSARTLQEALFRTANGSRPTNIGGPQWTRVLTVPANINAVVVRDSGEVWATTRTVGTYRSTDGGMTFAQVDGLTYEGSCLVERPGDRSLWMCANNLPPDLMAVGRSETGAVGTWTPRLRYADMVGPVRCQAGNNQRDDCEANLWCGLKDQMGATSEEIDCTAVDAPGPPPDDPKPCCGANGRPPGLEIGLAALFLLWRGRSRRRRRGAC